MRIKNDFKYIIAACLVTAIISFLPIFLYIWNFNSYSISNDPMDWGTFGDFLGGIIGTVLGFASFIVLIITIVQQRIALKQSQIDLKLSRRELKRSADAQEELKKVSEKQELIFKEQLQESRSKNLKDDLIKILIDLLSELEKEFNADVSHWRRTSKIVKFHEAIGEYSEMLSEGKNTEDFHLYYHHIFEKLKNKLSIYDNMIAEIKRIDEGGSISDYFEQRISFYRKKLQLGCSYE